MNFVIDALGGIIFRMSGERTDKWGGYIITRPGLRNIDNALCNFYRW